MGLGLIPKSLKPRYYIDERWHAAAILAADFPKEFKDIIECLKQFELVRSEIAEGGGGKTRIARRFDDFLTKRGWQEKVTEITMAVDGTPKTLTTHSVDFWKNKVAVEVEWNNKDPFFSRDLNAFRLLHELGIISVGVIITRSDELQDVFDSLGYVWDKKYKEWARVGGKYGASTTHWSKLMPSVERGGAGTCPLLLVAIKPRCYRDDIPQVAILTTKPSKPPIGVV
jgi:restriction endonuclease BglII